MSESELRQNFAVDSLQDTRDIFAIFLHQVRNGTQEGLARLAADDLVLNFILPLLDAVLRARSELFILTRLNFELGTTMDYPKMRQTVPNFGTSFIILDCKNDVPSAYR